MLKVLTSACFFVSLLGLLAGFMAAVHPSLDSVALLRPVFLVLCLAGLFVIRRAWLKIGYIAIFAFCFATVVPSAKTTFPGGDLLVYSKNLRFNNAQVDALYEDIQTSAPDVLMLQELSLINFSLMQRLKPTYPYQKMCRASIGVYTAIASKFPFAGPSTCSNRKALAAAKIEYGQETVWLVSIHIPWHWPIQSRQNETEAEQILKSLDGPIVMAGDFNSLPWTRRVSRLRDASDTQMAGPMYMTLSHRRLVTPLPIDFIFAPGGGSVKLRPLLGSDHHGLLGTVRVTR